MRGGQRSPHPMPAAGQMRVPTLHVHQQPPPLLQGPEATLRTTQQLLSAQQSSNTALPVGPSDELHSPSAHHHCTPCAFCPQITVLAAGAWLPAGPRAIPSFYLSTGQINPCNAPLVLAVCNVFPILSPREGCLLPRGCREGGVTLGNSNAR